MTKNIYLLNIENYAPEITAITYPAIEAYAEKIGALLIYITERKHPDMPPVYEKLQLYQLAKANPADWHIYIDSDCLLHSDTPDFTVMFEPGVYQPNSDPAHIRFNLERPDGRDIGTCNWFTVFHNDCLELFNPDIGLSAAEIYERCTPTEEEAALFDRTHLIDDFILSTNLAKHGFPYRNGFNMFFHHEYLITREQKAENLRKAAAVFSTFPGK